MRTLEDEMREYYLLIGLDPTKTKRFYGSHKQKMKSHNKPKLFMNIIYAKMYKHKYMTEEELVGVG